MIQLPGEKIVIPCIDNVVSANIPAKECQRLNNSLPDDHSKTGQLMKSLTVVVGMIVHTANVDVEDGLTNGATGVVKQTDFRMEGTNRPSIIWVLFDDPRVGRTTREKYRKLYNSSINSDWTPVFDVQRTFIVNYKTYQRIQFPLTPASGKSVWKAEGATIDRVVVDLSQEKKICKKPLKTHNEASASAFEPRYEKTGLRGFRSGPTQTGLYSHRRRLEA